MESICFYSYFPQRSYINHAIISYHYVPNNQLGYATCVTRVPSLCQGSPERVFQRLTELFADIIKDTRFIFNWRFCRVEMTRIVMSSNSKR
jgi:hypothetical protein